MTDNKIQLTIMEGTIIKLHRKGFHVYEIELETKASQEFIEKILYMYRRLIDSSIIIEFVE